ncbi:MAG TPA: hypothetical protein VOA41_12280 [Candidatus Dormibacteraeota bacterium]|nr:hypothetical protein [Candidatus Dormibacteraeota bacterium]
METWLAIFVGVTATAAVAQAIVLTAVYLRIRRTTDEVSRVASELQARVNPILMRVQVLVDDAQPRINNMIADAAHVVYLARGQAQKVDRVISEATERVRGQLIHTDRILTGLLEATEAFGSGMRRSVLRPVYKASALLKGVQVGLDFFRNHRRAAQNHGTDRVEAEEELFI